MARLKAKISLRELLKGLRATAERTDREAAHIEAEELLLRYINKPSITRTWNKASCNFWYS